MAIAFQGAADLGNNAGGAPLNSSYTVNALSNLLVAIIVGSSSEQNITSITYNGVAMTLGVVLAGANPGPARYGTGWYLFNPTTGNNTVVVTNTSDYIILGMADYSGAGAFESSNSVNGASPDTGITDPISTVAPGAWIIAGTSNDTGGGPPTAGAGLTRRAFDGAFSVWSLFDSGGPVTPGSNNVTVNFPSSISNSGMWAMAFSPATPVANCSKLTLLGVGCSLAAAKLVENPIGTRRRLIMPKLRW